MSASVKGRLGTSCKKLKRAGEFRKRLSRTSNPRYGDQSFRAGGIHGRCDGYLASDSSEDVRVVKAGDGSSIIPSDVSEIVCSDDSSCRNTTSTGRGDSYADDSQGDAISVVKIRSRNACQDISCSARNPGAKIRVLHTDKVPVLTENSPRRKVAVKEDLLKGDKVWQYICKRAVSILPLSARVSPEQDIGKDPHFQRNASKTIMTSVSIFGRQVDATITCEAAAAQEWLERQTDTLYGFDVEWRPNRGKHVDNKVALVQLSGAKECLVLQMLFMDSIPPALVNFLLDSEKRMGGVGVIEDASKLLRDYGLVCNGLVELTTLAVSQLGRPQCKDMGLKALAKEVIGVKMKKLRRDTLSDWGKPILHRSQVMYACIDAWVSFAVFQKLQVTDCETNTHGSN